MRAGAEHAVHHRHTPHAELREAGHGHRRAGESRGARAVRLHRDLGPVHRPEALREARGHHFVLQEPPGAGVSAVPAGVSVAVRGVAGGGKVLQRCPPAAADADGPGHDPRAHAKDHVVHEHAAAVLAADAAFLLEAAARSGGHAAALYRAGSAAGRLPGRCAAGREGGFKAVRLCRGVLRHADPGR